MTHCIKRGTPRSSERLSALGIPAYDIVRMAIADREIPVLLAGDEQTVWPHLQETTDPTEAARHDT